VLRSAATRKAFLQGPSHRTRFPYVPKHASRLDPIEIWFGILERRVIERGNFTSTADLRARIPAFIDSFNRTMAKQFKWTFTADFHGAKSPHTPADGLLGLPASRGVAV
jgi:hypothetical protein